MVAYTAVVGSAARCFGEAVAVVAEFAFDNPELDSSVLVAQTQTLDFEEAGLWYDSLGET